MATSKPHDAVFKAIFEQRSHAIALFQHMLSDALADTLVWPTLELDPSAFVDADLTDRHGDLLFIIETRERARRYLLLEHQSSHDAGMPLRMHVYQGQIWQRFRKSDEGPMPPIIPLLVSHTPGGWAGSPSLDAMLAIHADDVELAPFIPNLTMIVEDLARRSNEELDAALSSVIPKLTLWLLRDARDERRLLENLRYWALQFSAALHEPGGEHTMKPLVNYVTLVCDEPTWETFCTTIDELAPGARRTMMTIAEKWREEDLAKGRAEGRADVLAKLLSLEFGELSPEVKSRLASASSAEIDVWVERVLVCTSLDEVFAGSH